MSEDLKSMKLEKSEADKMYGGPSVMADSPMYPYGLKVSLDDEALKKLGLDALPKVGSVMYLEAKVEVCEVAAYDSKSGGMKKSIQLQITDMALGAVSEEKSESEGEKAEPKNPGVDSGAFYSAGPELRG